MIFVKKFISPEATASFFVIQAVKGVLPAAVQPSRRLLRSGDGRQNFHANAPRTVLPVSETRYGSPSEPI